MREMDIVVGGYKFVAKEINPNELEIFEKFECMMIGDGEVLGLLEGCELRIYTVGLCVRLVLITEDTKIYELMIHQDNVEDYRVIMKHIVGIDMCEPATRCGGSTGINRCIGYVGDKDLVNWWQVWRYGYESKITLLVHKSGVLIARFGTSEVGLEINIK